MPIIFYVCLWLHVNIAGVPSSPRKHNASLSIILIALLVGILLTQWIVVRGDDLPIPRWLQWLEGLRLALLGNMLFIAGMVYDLLPVLEITIRER